ncbi:MAG: thioredoxin domain-containing protein, partial [Verrucomicrobiota bacterium]
MSPAEENHARLPPPDPEVIASLPPDGGDEFNRLVFEKSPYLLQHARNPIDWWPWGEEAFAEAKRLDKPVFLSVGYSTCHWCHVMERESFEDEEVAQVLNEYFVCVKVDREERPDIDEVYMQITQAMTGSGGWPMTVVMTPDKHAFFAGTYFPKETRSGRMGVLHLAAELHRAWTEKREDVESTALNVSQQLGEVMGSSPGGDLDPSVFEAAFEGFRERFDDAEGGFAIRPKFPTPGNLRFLLRYHHRTGNEEALAMVEKTLTKMRLGGVYDQVGFGIHRYSTDREWLLPHFEKMLYDQALVVVAYLEAYQVTGKELFAQTAREILLYVERDMRSETGGFYSAEDADSEGVEGKFYVWSEAEVRELVGEDAEFVVETFQFTEEGNFREEKTGERVGTNIPHLADSLSASEREKWEPIRAKLFEAREKRIHPLKDDKILTDWNGLMISAFSLAAQVLNEPHYADIAQKAMDFVLKELRDGEGRLLKRYRTGEAGLEAHLEDYAFTIAALLDVYETTFEIRYLDEALTLQRIMDEFFWDESEGGYFMTADDAEQLIVRAKKLYGGAIPSGNSVALTNLVRFYRMTGQPHFDERSAELIRAFSGEIQGNAMVYPLTLCGLDFLLGPSYEIVLSGPDSEEMLHAIREPFLPNKVILHRTESNADMLGLLAPFTETQLPLDGETTVYVCQDFACQLPTTELSEVKESLGVSE